MSGIWKPVISMPALTSTKSSSARGVRDGNEGAHRLYRRVGFEVRRAVEVVVLRPAS